MVKFILVKTKIDKLRDEKTINIAININNIISIAEDNEDSFNSYIIFSENYKACELYVHKLSVKEILIMIAKIEANNG